MFFPKKGPKNAHLESKLIDRNIAIIMNIMTEVIIRVAMIIPMFHKYIAQWPRYVGEVLTK